MITLRQLFALRGVSDDVLCAVIEELEELKKRVRTLEKEREEIDRLWEPAFTQKAWEE